MRFVTPGHTKSSPAGSAWPNTFAKLLSDTNCDVSDWVGKAEPRDIPGENDIRMHRGFCCTHWLQQTQDTHAKIVVGVIKMIIILVYQSYN